MTTKTKTTTTRRSAKKAPAKKTEPTPVEATSPTTAGNVFKAQYRAHMVTTTNEAGAIRIDNGDDIAKQLRNLDLDAIYKLAAKETGEAEKALRDRYAGLNRGMQRMNLGNKIRGALSRKAKAAAANAA